MEHVYVRTGFSFTLEPSRVESLVALARRWLATLRTCEVEQTTEAKARMENCRDVRSGKLRSWTPCVQPRVEPHSWRAAIYCARARGRLDGG